MKTKINSQHLALCQTVIKKPLCGQLPSRTRCCHCRPPCPYSPCPLAPSMPLTRARGGCVCARVRAWVRVRACVLCNWSEQWPTVPKYKRSLDNAFVCLFVCCRLKCLRRFFIVITGNRSPPWRNAVASSAFKTHMNQPRCVPPLMGWVYWVLKQSGY